jgi:radical SAM superfamily enzyme YgiQ (UPF0313 family)
LLGRLKKCGLAFIGSGIESGNEEGLRTFNKRFSVDDVFRAVGILDELGIDLEYGFMMFDPFSSFQSIRANVAFLQKLCADGRVPVRFTKMVPLIGTPITRRLSEMGGLRGTIVEPTYTFQEKKLDLLELFWGKSFGNVFRRGGLVDRLRSARKELVVVNKFFPDHYHSTMADSITRLIKAFNASAFETIHKAINFMEERSYEDILYYWWILDKLCQEEVGVQSKIVAALDKLGFAESHVRAGAEQS